MIHPHVGTWPKWIEGLDPAIPPALQQIDAAQSALIEACRIPFTYLRLGQIQANVIYQDAMRSGSIDPKASGEFPSKSASQEKVKLTPKAVRIGVLNWAQPYHQLNLVCFAKGVICLKLTDGARFGFESDNLFVAFSCIRALLEHVGHLNLLLDELASIPEPTSIEESRHAWQRWAGVITKRVYATRVDWTKLAAADFSHEKAKAFHYHKSDFHADMEATDLLKAVDKLNHAVPGTRLAYDVLCEFVHPNYGTIYAATEGIKFEKDQHGIIWQKRRIGVGFPGLVTTTLRQTLVDILLIYSSTLNLLLTLRHRATEIASRLLCCVQFSIREAIGARTGVFERNESCPCGSGKKVKRCCGLAIH
jgi:hypothetical protein